MLRLVPLSGLALISAFVWAGAEVPEQGASLEPILPLHKPVGLDERKVQLGRKLFHDKRLSSDDSISCASCHELKNAGVDNQQRSTGVGGAKGLINAPTVFNSAFNVAQFWDGRAKTLEEQVAGPIHNELEMASSWKELVAKLNADDALRAEFRVIYPDGVQPANISDAIAFFERSLVTLNAPFDLWLKGDKDAIDGVALEGYRLFRDYGCISCHQGRNVGGNMFAELGSKGNYFKDRGGEMTREDLGRFNVTQNESDKYVFKVPSLRLAGKTTPYFHDGSVQKLSEAVAIMGKYQLGRAIPQEDCDKISAFLQSLSGVPSDTDNNP